MGDPVDRRLRTATALAARLAWRRLAFSAAFMGTAATPLLRTIARAVWRVLQIPVALLFLFFEWGWRPLAMVLARLHSVTVIASFEAWVVTLAPYPSLAVFALPAIFVLPLKLLALWLITGGHTLYAALLFIGAKIVGTAIVARLFVLLQPKLMAIGWFRRAYETLMPWKERVFAAIRASFAWRVGAIIKYRIVRGSTRYLRPIGIAVRHVLKRLASIGTSAK